MTKKKTNLSPSYTVTIQAPIHHDSSRFETDGKIGMRPDGKKRNSSINTMSHDAPTVSARFIYGSTTTHDGSATIHHGGATNAHDASAIRYGASTIQAGSATSSHECTRFSGCHATVLGGEGLLSFFSICRFGPSIYRSLPPSPTPPPKKN